MTTAISTKIPRRNIIIDTDPGLDDAIAIMLLEKSECFNICAVTTVAGNSTIENTTNNARYVLDFIGSTSALFSGSATPLERPLVQANVHGETGLSGIHVEKSVPLTGNAVEKIIEIAKEKTPVTIVALGPLTNIALAIKRDPTIIPLIEEIIIMGGAIAVPGNKSRVAEFNIFVDPEAADIVFRSSIPKLMVPLDACNPITVPMEKFEVLKDTPLYDILRVIVPQYIAGVKKFEETEVAPMYDPLAAYYLVRPEAYTIESMDVKIETKGELTSGMTVADRRSWGEKTANVRVATSINQESFTRDLLSILSTTGAVRV